MSSLAGIGLKILSTILFAIMIALIKLVGDEVPTGQIVFARSFFALIPLFALASMQGSWRDCLRTEQPWLHARRSIVGTTAMFCWFAAITMIPLPEATAISFLAPLIIVALAALFLKEVIRAYRWSAVAIGFVGVLIILGPRLSFSGDDVGLAGALLAAMSTILMAVAVIMVRQMTRSENNAAIMFYFFATAAGVSLFSLYWGWVIPDWETGIMLVAIGFLGAGGQTCATQAFRVSEASLLAPYDYVNMVWAVIIGIVLFAEYPSLQVLLGGACVILAGLFVLFRERRLGIESKAEDRSKPLSP